MEPPTESYGAMGLPRAGGIFDSRRAGRVDIAACTKAFLWRVGRHRGAALAKSTPSLQQVVPITVPEKEIGAVPITVPITVPTTVPITVPITVPNSK